MRLIPGEAVERVAEGVCGTGIDAAVDGLFYGVDSAGDVVSIDIATGDVTELADISGAFDSVDAATVSGGYVYFTGELLGGANGSGRVKLDGTGLEIDWSDLQILRARPFGDETVFLTSTFRPMLIDDNGVGEPLLPQAAWGAGFGLEATTDDTIVLSSVTGDLVEVLPGGEVWPIRDFASSGQAEFPILTSLAHGTHGDYWSLSTDGVLVRITP